ncbi:MAG TPA: PDZ domain-containing protein, partial [Fodinibius sp.]|nr:PDZ domain-containing protein [Fodinibius sp.]
SEAWKELVEQANNDSLSIKTVPDGVGASDHTSFYNKNIPVLHYFTDTHADYHRPSDDPQYINYQGEVRVLKHLQRVVTAIDTLSEAIGFTEAPVTRERDVTLEGPTLGVTPDYGFDGHGMRITSATKGDPAAKAGLQGKDIIISLAGKEVTDIYKYMEILNTLSEDQKTTVTVSRGETEHTFDITL